MPNPISAVRIRFDTALLQQIDDKSRQCGKPRASVVRAIIAAAIATDIDFTPYLAADPVRPGRVLGSKVVQRRVR